ncbi:MAG: segregation/condensation protein A [Patescibacteria group bacterium]|nr:segregation/condensation protein A [Patescibacteria group bacterium]
MYELKTENFSGPLEKLLELIEEQKMDVSEVSMARVTDDFLRYLEKIKNSEFDEANKVETIFHIDLRILADFIAVASKLIFLKSKYLLPGLALTEEEEADIKELEGRLKVYQELKPALKHLAQLWRESHRAYSRPYFLGRGGGLAAGQSIFYPGANLNLEALAGSLGRIFETIKTYELETETIKEKIITLEEKISEVVGRIERDGDMHLKKLSASESRADMIIAFLAILHLAREQIILLEQMDNFSDILVRKK